MRHFWIRGTVVAALMLVAVGGLTMSTGASTPSSATVTVPTTPGSQTVTWSGTISAANAHPTSDCNDPGSGPPDQFSLTVQPPAGGYSTVDATFTFSITWAPSNPTGDETANDEVLTVDAPGVDQGDTQGPEVGSSDTGETTETVVAHDLGPGTYSVLACGYNNVTAQDYTGTVKVDVTPKSASAPLPSADPQGLAFSAAVPSDPQRDVAEPLIVSDKAGLVYTCGPTGFSNGSDYANVSTDGGDQFHLLGTPPRGQQSDGGGGDCALATGEQPNAFGNYTYAYTGLGALSGFATSSSQDNGQTLTPGGADTAGGVTTKGALADRQWMTFVDDKTVLLSYNQQQPRNVVVIHSNDGGVTYSLDAAIAAPDADFPGPMRYIPSSHSVVMPWTKGESVNLAVSRDGGLTWFDCNVSHDPKYVGGGTAGFATADVDQDGNVYVAWADKSNYHVWLSSVTAASLATCDQTPADVTAASKDGVPVKQVGSTPSQVDRDEVKTTVFPWVAAGGVPGRVAVAFYGTDQDGDPNTGSFKAAWNVYVSQSLDGLDGASAQFGQVKATTHPFHYDSICLNGLGCDLAVPAGDRSLADFFAITYNRKDGRLSVVFDRGNKRPDDASGYVATPMVVNQIAGPSNGGGTVSAGSPVVRTSSSDPTGDAIANYSAIAGATPGPRANVPAADLTSVSVGPDAASQGFTVTMKVSDLSTAALTSALATTGTSSLDYVFRFTNGWQDAGASASWSPAGGWQFGFDDYTAGSAQCGSDGEKCVIWPQATKITGSVDQAAGTITLVVPASVLHPLTGVDQWGRPTQGTAAVGSRFPDAVAFTFANPQAQPSASMSWMEQLDNTPAMDFLLPAATSTPSSGGGGGGTTGSGNGGTSSGGGNGGTSNGNGTGNNHGSSSGGVKGTTKTVSHMVVARGVVRASLNTSNARAWINRKSVLYVDRKAHVRFRSTAVTSVAIRGHSATLRGVGVRNGTRGVRFRVVLVAGKPATLHVWFGRYVRSGRLVHGVAIVR